MDEVSGCPSGAPGMEGWSGTDAVVGRQVNVQSVFSEQERRIQTKTKEFFYIDRTNREIGIRTSTGGRVFVNLDEVLEFLKKELP